ncbi:MAG: HypE family hydrogenase expression/formation protein, partial [Blastocatellia bacterium]
PIVLDMLDAGIEIHCMRDLTRGGLASALIEIAESGNTHINISEIAVPVREDVRGACEILGFDPLYLANEGRFIVFVPSAEAERAVETIRRNPVGEGATLIGTVTDGQPRRVTMKSRIGATRIVDMFTGEQLPRIC